MSRDEPGSGERYGSAAEYLSFFSAVAYLSHLAKIAFAGSSLTFLITEWSLAPHFDPEFKEACQQAPMRSFLKGRLVDPEGALGGVVFSLGTSCGAALGKCA